MISVPRDGLPGLSRHIHHSCIGTVPGVAVATEGDEDEFEGVTQVEEAEAVVGFAAENKPEIRERRSIH